MKVRDLLEDLEMFDLDDEVLVYVGIGEEHGEAAWVRQCERLDTDTWKYDRGDHPFDDEYGWFDKADSFVLIGG